MKKLMSQSDLVFHKNNKFSFILRLWRADQSKMTNWQASIEIPETGKRIGFASLEQLFAFLLEFTDQS